MNKKNDLIKRLKHILDTEEGLSIPSIRKDDYMWLLRNFSINNSIHPKHDEIMRLLRNIALDIFKQ